MNILLHNLLDLLEEEAWLLESLLSVLRKEKKAIVCARIGDLNKACKEKENLILKIRIIEEQRVNILKKLAGCFDISQEALTVTGLSRLIEKPLSDRLGRCFSKLLFLTESIHEINRNNEGLIEHSIDLVRASMVMLEDLIAPGSVYYKNGKSQPGGHTGRVLSGLL